MALLGSFPVYPYRYRVRFWSDRPDLTTTWNYNLAKALADTGRCDVHVLTNAPLLRTRSIETEGFTVHFVGHLPKLDWWDYVTRFRYSKWHLHSILRRLQPSIVHGSGTDHEYAYIATSYDGPSVFTVHGVMQALVGKLGELPWSLNVLLARYERLVAERARFMIAISEYVARQFPQFAGRVYRIPNAVAPTFFEATPTDRYDVVFIGRLVPAKGAAHFVETVDRLVARHPQLRAAIVGSGGDSGFQQSLRETVRRKALDEHVTFLGRREQREVASLMAGAKVLILPSVEESFSMVCAEAQAAGTPVVASRVGGLPEVVADGETGLLVAPGDLGALVRAVQQLLENDGLRNRMVERARKRARELFHPAAIAQATVAAYEEIIARWWR